LATHFHTLTIAAVQKETPECISVLFQVPEALRETYNFKQGQNITLKTILDGEEVRRSYSICSSPYDNELKVAIKAVEAGKFSSWANLQLKKGDAVDVLPPTGRFFTELNPAHTKHYLAFAAGSGITPVLSIIKATLAIEPNSRFTLIYGNRNRASIIFKEQLEGLKNRYINRFTLHHILSREKTDAAVNHGRIDAEKCQQLEMLVHFSKMDEIFICGPESMIFSVKEWLEAKGIDKKKIHFELFTTPTSGSKQVATSDQQEKAGKTNKKKTSRITVKLDGIAFDFDLAYDGQPILDAALQQGADLPFACKGGVCATCRAKLTEGEVEMDINYALEPEEIEQRFILTCQSHPRTDKVVVDFDAR
jgi:ring-1,2-phenylacetyl-CoA epoxidase subunit PaaE